MIPQTRTDAHMNAAPSSRGPKDSPMLMTNSAAIRHQKIYVIMRHLSVTGDTIVDNGHEFGKVFLTDVYDWDVAGTCSQYKGNVLLIHGVADKTVEYEQSLKALTEYYAQSNSELVLITGKQSVHAFDVFWEPGQIIAWNAVIDYMATEVAR